MAKETFTWECLWKSHCDGCLVAGYVEANDLDESQQKELLDLATAAGAYLHSPNGMALEDVVETLYLHSPSTGLDVEEFKVAVDGWTQWDDRSCRANIRNQAVLQGEFNGKDF